MNSPIDLELDRLFDEAVQRARSERFVPVEPATLARLSLLPEWTVDLATTLGLGAADGLDLDGLVEAGLVDARTSIESDGHRDRIFWLRPSERIEVGRFLRGSRGRQLAGDLDGLAARVRGLDRAAIDLHKLQPWLQVVDVFQDDRSGLSLVREVDTQIAEGRPAEAVRLVAAATVLGDIVGGTLADAARRAQWRIDRDHRNERDEQYLRHYVGRAATEAAVTELLEEGADRWILHLRGDAGVGKTMLVRYLSSARFTGWGGDRRQRPVARVDFDHLPPRYPEQRPGELLLALTAELLGYGETRAAGRAHRRLVAAVDQLHEELSRRASRSDHGERLEGIVVDRFADFLTELPAPPLLILDTCEELAKLYPPGASAPAIDRTFDLLEQTHNRVPGIRVLLAGRRWLVPPDDARRRAAEPLLRDRPHVRVLPIEGFTAPEARLFVVGHLTGMSVTDEQIEALLLAAAAAPGSDRYNPFELHAYCEWLRHEPDLDVRALLDAPGDPYVERRILGRLGDGPAKQALPVAVAYARFDLALVAPALERIGVDVAKAFADLAAQEWMNIIELGPTGAPYLVEVDPHLCERLRALLALEPPVTWDQLGRDAAAVVLRGGLSRTPAETVEAALRLLKVDEAGELWSRLDHLIVDEREWAWAAQVSARAAGVEAHARPDGPTVLAAIFATQAAARLHTGRKRDVATMWDQVVRYADRHPDDRAGESLRVRAALGRLAAGATGDVLASAQLAIAPVTAVIAALESCIERECWSQADQLIAFLEGADGPVDGDARAVAVQLARVVVGLQRDELVADLAAAAVAAAESLPAQAPGAYGDWLVPDRLLDRCRLALLLATLAEPAVRPPADELARWAVEASGRLHTVDGERLLSALCVITPLTDLTLTRYVPGRSASHWVHLQLSPLAVSMTETLEAHVAVPLLEDQIAAAVAAGDDPDTVEACQLALLRRCRRDRHLGYVPNIEELAQRGSPLLRAEAWLTLVLVDSRTPQDVEAAGSYAGWWQVYTRDLRNVPPSEGPEIFSGSTETMRADRALTLRCSPGSGEPPASLAGTAASLNPVLLADRARRHIALYRQQPPRPAGLPEGLMDRAVFTAAETLALREPDVASEVLLDLAIDMAERDANLAWRAAVLATLTSRRARASRRHLEARRLVRMLERVGAEDESVVWQRRRSAALSINHIDLWWAVPDVSGKSVMSFWQRYLTNTRTWVAVSVCLLIVGVLSVTGAIGLLAWLLISAAIFTVGFGGLAFNKILHPAIRHLVLDIGVLGADWYGIRCNRFPSVPILGSKTMRSPHRFPLELVDKRVPCGFLRQALDNKNARTVLGLSVEEASEAWSISWEQRLGRHAKHDRAEIYLWHRIMDAKALPMDSSGPNHYFGPSHLDIMSTSNLPAGTSGVLHVIGTPVETAAGTRWRVDDGDSSAESSRGAAGLLAIEKSVIEGSVVVLQAPPVDGMAQALGEQRTAFLETARTVVAAGANAVFILPPLRDAAAFDTAALIMQDVVVMGKQLRRRTLLEILERLKARVAREESPERSWSDRPVLDVLLITRR